MTGGDITQAKSNLYSSIQGSNITVYEFKFAKQSDRMPPSPSWYLLFYVQLYFLMFWSKKRFKVHINQITSLIITVIQS